jgi:hypothetical protein
MTAPKRHHYLPKFYLEGFCRDNVLWVYDRDTKEFRKQTPLNTAVQRYYYSFEKDDGEKTADIEDFLALVETHAKPVLDKIHTRETINDNEKVTLSLIIGFLYSRVPSFGKSVNDITVRIVEHLSKVIFADEKITESAFNQYEQDTGRKINITPKELSEFARSDGNDREVHQNESLTMMLELSTKLPVYFLQMNWLFLFAPGNLSFVTTDKPFVLIPPRELADNVPYGLATKRTQKFIPLTQQVCFVLLDHGENIKIREATREEVREINRRITSRCDRFVIARDEALVRSLVKSLDFH